VRRRRRFALAAVAATILATTPLATPARAGSSNVDPWERMNRKVFWFNDKLDTYALEPAARGWDFVVPDVLERSIDNFSNNLLMPLRLANNLLQGKPRAAFDAVSRFILNSTLGMAGLFDPATQVGLPEKPEDFGQTLGVWGVGPGPYLVLPFLGPSTVRDTGGYPVDWAMQVWPYFVGWRVSAPYRAATLLNKRALFLEEIASAKKGALDYYALVRNAYLQHREALVTDSPEKKSEEQEDLYYFDVEEDVEE